MVNEKTKATIRVVLDLEFDLNQEHTYALITRLEGNIHRQIQLGMMSSDHPNDAALVDFKVEVNEK